MNADAIRDAVRGDGRRRIIGSSVAVLGLLLVLLLLVVTSCGGDGNSAAADKQREKEKATGPSEAVVAVAPKDGAKNVATTGALEVTASKGKLTKVTVKDEENREVPGKLAKGGASWKPEGHLRTKTEYTVDAQAEDSEGRVSAKHAVFSTVVPDDTFVGRFTPDDGTKVGVGMPVSITFNRPVENREAVEKALEVTADPEVDVEGHWFGDERIDFRPEKYWKAGTKVSLKMNLNGVEGAKGVYGTQQKTVDFTVGRSQVSVVDVKKKQMTVTRDGKKIKTIPITAGAPPNTTYNGKMVISEKHEVTRMNGETVGFGDEYDIKDVPHAMRLSTSGTFIHGNYWAGKPTFGSANTSHGCVGLFDLRGGGTSTPGAWFFKNSMIGDVVEVKNSKDETIAPDNGFNAWNMDWEEWTKS
ncbi:L,D-transpeptidase [Streptomyces armeniacus]|uniref:L,D-transpeptidase n=1 Tax=Streptomyces armeniacus TaxID=83291 RepID=UPI003CCC7CEE